MGQTYRSVFQILSPRKTNKKTKMKRNTYVIINDESNLDIFWKLPLYINSLYQSNCLNIPRIEWFSKTTYFHCKRLTCCIFSIKNNLLRKSLGNDPFGSDRQIHDSLSFSVCVGRRGNPSPGIRLRALPNKPGRTARRPRPRLINQNI